MKVTFELEITPEQLYELMQASQIGKSIPKGPVKDEAEANAESAEEPELEPKVKTKPTTEIKTVVAITPDEMRRAFMAKNNTENRPKLKAILDEFGSANISGLDPQHYEAAMERLEALS